MRACKNKRARESRMTSAFFQCGARNAPREYLRAGHVGSLSHPRVIHAPTRIAFTRTMIRRVSTYSRHLRVSHGSEMEKPPPPPDYRVSCARPRASVSPSDIPVSRHLPRRAVRCLRRRCLRIAKCHRGTTYDASTWERE